MKPDKLSGQPGQSVQRDPDGQPLPFRGCPPSLSAGRESVQQQDEPRTLESGLRPRHRVPSWRTPLLTPKTRLVDGAGRRSLRTIFGPTSRPPEGQA